MLYRVVDARKPELARRMIFMTGGAYAPRAQEFLDLVPNARLDKPIDWPALRRTLDELAD